MKCSIAYASNETDGPQANMIDGLSAEPGNRKLEMMPPDRLVPSKHNARTHSQRQIHQIADSIRRFEFNSPVLIGDDCEVIAGHGRLKAAMLLGLAAVPTLRLSHLSAAEKRAYIIADNRLSEKAGWDGEILAAELQGLIDLEFDVELTGFAADEIALVVDRGKSDKAETKSRAPRHEAKHSFGATVSRPGDVWLLGDHRLVCGDGDANDADAVLRQWEAQTGKQAILATGQTLRDVAAQREPAVPRAISLPHAAAIAEVR